MYIALVKLKTYVILRDKILNELVEDVDSVEAFDRDLGKRLVEARLEEIVQPA